jgi:hypothetical protein
MGRLTFRRLKPTRRIHFTRCVQYDPCWRRAERVKRTRALTAALLLSVSTIGATAATAPAGVPAVLIGSYVWPGRAGIDSGPATEVSYFGSAVSETSNGVILLGDGRAIDHAGNLFRWSDTPVGDFVLGADGKTYAPSARGIQRINEDLTVTLVYGDAQAQSEGQPVGTNSRPSATPNGDVYLRAPLRSTFTYYGTPGANCMGVRRVDHSTGLATTVAGANCSMVDTVPDGSSNAPNGYVLDAHAGTDGSLYILTDCRIRRIAPNGVVSTVMGKICDPSTFPTSSNFTSDPFSQPLLASTFELTSDNRIIANVSGGTVILTNGTVTTLAGAFVSRVLANGDFVINTALERRLIKADTTTVDFTGYQSILSGTGNVLFLRPNGKDELWRRSTSGVVTAVMGTAVTPSDTKPDAPAIGGLGVSPESFAFEPNGDILYTGGGVLRRLTTTGRSRFVATLPNRTRHQLFETRGAVYSISGDVASSTFTRLNRFDGSSFVDVPLPPAQTGVLGVAAMPGGDLIVATFDYPPPSGQPDPPRLQLWRRTANDVYTNLGATGVVGSGEITVDDTGTIFVLSDIITRWTGERMIPVWGARAVNRMPTQRWALTKDGTAIRCDAGGALEVIRPNGSVGRTSLPPQRWCSRILTHANDVVIAAASIDGPGDTYLYRFSDFISDLPASIESLANPERILDTRPNSLVGYVGSKPAADRVVEVQVAGRAGVPTIARSAVFNLTASDATEGGYVTVWPCDEPRPTTSNLNYEQSETVANLVVARLDKAGKVCLYTKASTHLLIDIASFFAVGTDFRPLGSPQRVLDTRPGGQVGYVGAKPAAGAVVRLPIAGKDGIPADASSVVLNVTAADATASGYATVFPCTAEVPTVSNLNFRIGENAANVVISPVASDGSICIFTQSSAHFLVDLAGYLPMGSAFGAINPVRVLDTRAGGQIGYSGTKPEGDGVVSIDIAGTTGVPPSSTLMLTITAVDASRGGYITVWPCEKPRPLASNLNLVSGMTRPNSVVVRADSNGLICIFTDGGTHLLADLAGWFPPRAA